MIRQKRYSITRASHNAAKLSTADANAQNLKTDPEREKASAKTVKCPASEPRAGLSEIVGNATNRESAFLKVLDIQNKFQPQQPPKHKESIFSKISELIRIEDIPMPICHSTKPNPLKSLRDRPFTSFSHSTKVALDQSQLNKFTVVLDLSRNEEPLPPEKSSTSRALMNYSKVYRNNSNDGFRVKKNMSIMNRFVHLSAQKVVFQEKEKREKSVDKAVSFRKSTNSKKTPRYKQEEEDFELGGWDYFE